MKTYGLYFSTYSTSKYTPTYSSLNQVKFQVNWDEVFGNSQHYPKRGRVRARFISGSTTGLTWANNIGSIRINWGHFSNSTQGLNLGMVRPYTDFATTTNIYLDLDSTTSNGISCVIPQSGSEMIVTLLDKSESLMFMNTIAGWQLFLYVDVDE